VAILGCFLFRSQAAAEVAVLNNGMQFEGNIGKIASLGENPLSPQGGGQVKTKQIVLVDDDLRRTFFSQIQTQSVAPKQASLERIQIDQRVAKGGRRIGAVGPIFNVTPFDEWGRRVFSMNTGQGQVDVVQGITEVTPVYTRVEGLQARSAYVWDMRIATSAIPRETLSKILLHQIKKRDPDDRLRVVRLYIQAERYNDARAELEGVIKDFPALAELKKQVQSLQQVGARRMIDEIKLRRDVGQHGLAYKLLDGFPSEGVAGEILVQVRDLLAEYHDLKKKAEQALQRLQKHFAEIQDEKAKTDLQPAFAEIQAELNIHTFDRLADYLRLASDPKSMPEQKVALATSGWLLGSGSGTDVVGVAASLYEVRRLVRAYLNSTQTPERNEILQQLQSLEGASPAYVAKLLARMKPAVETPAPAGEMPGLYELTVPGLAENPEITYYVQLPPEYDPYRRYPAVVTLNGAGTTPQHQLDWWAGAYSEQAQMRIGQATRRGYLVIAPQWTKPHQREYEFSAREHAAVLHSLRDACRRFSIDTDRVLLSGHSMGGDAAWDIGLAHPDLWAGVIPIVAAANKYVTRYWENGRYVPLYFVAGEMDGDKLARNTADWDRYLTRHTYDTIVVVYQGRGHEHFQDEIQRVFQWMGLHRRNFFRSEFKAWSLRPWDNFFWWAEVEDLPRNAQVLPVNWPPEAGIRPAEIEGKTLATNRISLSTQTGRAVVWLAPEMVDFSKRIAVMINGRDRGQGVQPNLEVLLEDVRTRGDRQHPFWAKVESQTGRGSRG
jgi:pimeloyl-ACP methyl ester carboxylesterase